MAIDILMMWPMKWIEQDIGSDFILHRPWLAVDRVEFLRMVGECIRGIVSYSGAPAIDAAIFSALPHLEIIVNMGAGYENIDIALAKARGIVVTNAGAVNAVDVAEYAFGLILDVARGLSAGDRFIRAGLWTRDGSPPLRHRVSGRGLGIVGLGNIGRAIARMAAGFDMPVSYHNRRADPDLPYRYYPSVVELAHAVDFLVVATPGGTGTRHLIDRATLDALGPDGVLINVARGSVVDQAALIAALAAGRLGGAGLDVFEDEPNVPPALLALPNVVVEPHRGGATPEAIGAATGLVIANLRAHFSGGEVKSRVA